MARFTDGNSFGALILQTAQQVVQLRQQQEQLDLQKERAEDARKQQEETLKAKEEQLRIQEGNLELRAQEFTLNEKVKEQEIAASRALEDFRRARTDEIKTGRSRSQGMSTLSSVRERQLLFPALVEVGQRHGVNVQPGMSVQSFRSRSREIERELRVGKLSPLAEAFLQATGEGSAIEKARPADAERKALIAEKQQIDQMLNDEDLMRAQMNVLNNFYPSEDGVRATREARAQLGLPPLPEAAVAELDAELKVLPFPDVTPITVMFGSSPEVVDGFIKDFQENGDVGPFSLLLQRGLGNDFSPQNLLRAHGALLDAGYERADVDKLLKSALDSLSR